MRGGVVSKSEQAVQQRVRLKSSQQGRRMWRNNVGAVTAEDGRHIRFGLANESAPQNKILKSSDLIGVTPVVITPEMVGQTVGVFTAFEIKREAWHFTNSEREQAQLAFINLVNSLGGIAGFVNNEDQI